MAQPSLLAHRGDGPPRRPPNGHIVWLYNSRLMLMNPLIFTELILAKFHGD